MLNYSINPTTYNQLEVLGQSVDIHWLQTRLMDAALGRCLTDEQEIHIRNDLRGLQCLDTFLHELYHYISDHMRLELSENQVQILGRVWAEIFQKNPELVGFIAERCQEEDERRTTRFARVPARKKTA